MIYIITKAYNAEKTLIRAVDSILNQTYDNFIYYLLDNGSTDMTGKIVNEYAAKDKRIVSFHNTQNNVRKSETDRFYEFYKTLNEDDYFCILDADDEYYPDFLSDMLKFCVENNLDFASCGSDFWSVEKNSLVGRRELSRDLILERNDFADYFPVYYQFMRTTWGKMIRGTVGKSFKEQDATVFIYGGDTYSIIELLSISSKVGILSKKLHRYYVSGKTASFIWETNRINVDRILYSQAIDFNITKNGYVSPKNQTFLYNVYLNAIIDTINVLIKVPIDIAEKFRGLRDILENKITLDMLGHEGVPIEKRKALVEWVFNIVNNFPAVSEYENAIWLGMNLTALLDKSNDYIKYCKLNIAWLIKQKRIDDAQRELADWVKIMPDDDDFKEFYRKIV